MNTIATHAPDPGAEEAGRSADLFRANLNETQPHPQGRAGGRANLPISIEQALANACT